jgi:hypothetical protein
LKPGQQPLDYAGKLVINAEGVAVYNFGKAQGKAVKTDKGFGNWMLDQPFIPLQTKNILRALLNS